MVWKETGSRLPRGMTPQIIRGPRAGGGSFSNDPYVLYDQVLTFNGTGPNDGGFRFTSGDSKLSQNGGGFIVSVDTLPLQFVTTRPGPIPFGISARYILLFDSNVTAFVFDFPSVDVWLDIGTRPYDMIRPIVAMEGFTLRMQLAPTLDVTDIQAQADIRYEWTP